MRNLILSTLLFGLFIQLGQAQNFKIKLREHQPSCKDGLKGDSAKQCKYMTELAQYTVKVGEFLQADYELLSAKVTGKDSLKLLNDIFESAYGNTQKLNNQALNTIECINNGIPFTSIFDNASLPPNIPSVNKSNQKQWFTYYWASSKEWAVEILKEQNGYSIWGKVIGQWVTTMNKAEADLDKMFRN